MPETHKRSLPPPSHPTGCMERDGIPTTASVNPALKKAFGLDAGTQEETIADVKRVLEADANLIYQVRLSTCRDMYPSIWT